MYQLEQRVQELAEKGISQGKGAGKGREGAAARVQSAETEAASKVLTRSLRSMRASVFGGGGTAANSSKFGRQQGTGEGAEGRQEMPVSMRTQWMQHVHMTESVMQLRQIIKWVAWLSMYVTAGNGWLQHISC